MFELKPPSDDRQHIPTVGEWSHDKYYFIPRRDSKNDDCP